VGAIIADKYRIEEFVGSGAMSVVALALHLELEQLVAIKFLHAVGFDHEQSAQRFKREARAAAKIQSEHVTRVLDVGTLPEGCPYIVMEHLRGNDLAEELAKRGPLPAAEVAGYVLQACEALAEAHGAGIVHRDLKPENLFLAERADGSRSVKVLDFGISKSMSQSLTDLSLTGTASFMGSPLYMSPEQMRSSRNVDARTDIWSIGTVLYEMVSGALPFSAESIPELCLAVIGDQPKPLRERTENLPPGFEAIVERCLEKDRERRYSTVAELAQALSPFAPSGVSSAERTGRIIALSGTPTERAAGVAGLALPSRRNAESTPPLALAASATAPRAAQPSRLRSALAKGQVRLAIAAGVGLALGALVMRSGESSAPEQAPTAASEIKPLPVAAAPEPRIELVTPLSEASAPRAASRAAEAAPRSATAAHIHAALSTARPVVAVSASSQPAKPAPSESPPKPVNAWDPAAFGDRY
jgi:serine/threonine-protein kinase